MEKGSRLCLWAANWVLRLPCCSLCYADSFFHVFQVVDNADGSSKDWMAFVRGNRDVRTPSCPRTLRVHLSVGSWNCMGRTQRQHNSLLALCSNRVLSLQASTAVKVVASGASYSPLLRFLHPCGKVLALILGNIFRSSMCNIHPLSLV